MKFRRRTVHTQGCPAFTLQTVSPDRVELGPLAKIARFTGGRNGPTPFPPLLVASGDRRRIVDGHRRFHAAGETATPLPSLVLAEGEVTEPDELAIFLAANSLTHSRSFGLFLLCLHYFLKLDGGGEYDFPLTEIFPDPGRLNLGRKIDQLGLFSEWNEPLHQMPEKDWPLFLALSPEDRQWTLEIARNYSLTHSQRSLFLEAAWFLSRAHREPFAVFFAREIAPDLPGHDENLPSAREELMERVHQKRHPDSHPLHREFQRLNLARQFPALRIEATRNFENRRMTLTASFEREEELKKIHSDVGRLLEDGALTRFLRDL